MSFAFIAHFHLPRVLFQENCKIGKKCLLKHHYHGSISLLSPLPIPQSLVPLSVLNRIQSHCFPTHKTKNLIFQLSWLLKFHVQRRIYVEKQGNCLNLSITACLISFIFQQYTRGFKVEFSLNRDSVSSHVRSRNCVCDPLTTKIAAMP